MSHGEDDLFGGLLEDPDEDVSPDDANDEEVDEGADTQASVVELPGEQGFLVLAGPGAGTVVRESSSSVLGTVPALPSLPEALNGHVPLMLLHRTAQFSSGIPRLLANIYASTVGNLTLGAVAALPGASLVSNREWLGKCGAASVRIADPMGFLMDQPLLRLKEVSQRSLRWAPYLAGTKGLKDILDAQREVGATLLLTTGRALDSAGAQASLDAACAEGDDALALLESGERLALNLTMSASWLTNPKLRKELFAQIIDQQQFSVLYVRVQWPSSIRSMAQPIDAALLDGYKSLAELALDEERVLLLPQTGLTGWLQFAFGAVGFGAGATGSAHAFKEHAGGGGGSGWIERYFEQEILHSVERTIHDALLAAGHVSRCQCPYCPALRSRAPGWSHELASYHHLYQMGLLAGRAGSARNARGGALAEIRRIVRTATSKAAPLPLAGISSPIHLAAWDRIL